MTDHRSYDLAQQGFLTCLLEDDHERRLAGFIRGLRNDQQWSQSDVDCVEQRIRQMLSDMRLRM